MALCKPLLLPDFDGRAVHICDARRPHFVDECVTEEEVSFRLNPPTVARESLLDSVVQDVEDGILVFLYRDGMQITREQARERARNIVAGLVGNYKVEELSVWS
jgi:hypothetical protein